MGRTGDGAASHVDEPHLHMLPPMADDVVDRVKRALENGASLTQTTNGRPVGGGKRNPKLITTSFKIIRRYRQENPDFNRCVISAISDSLVVGQRIRHQRRLNAAKREEANDYHSIRSMLPANFPNKDDLVSAIFEETRERQGPGAGLHHGAQSDGGEPLLPQRDLGYRRRR